MRCRSLAPFLLFVIPLFTGAVAAQEDTRHVAGDLGVTKHLTRDHVDRWIIQAKKNETVIVSVVSTNFDPVIQLVRKNADAVTEKIDDEGSTAGLRVRLPEAGEYHLLVHAFKKTGGGNYRIVFERFLATPIAVDTTVSGTIPIKGVTHHYFTASADEILIPDVSGAAVSWTIRDAKGSPVQGWERTAQIAKTGEHVISIHGQRHSAYRLHIRRASRLPLRIGAASAEPFAAAGLHAWRFDAKAGDFRLIEVKRSAGVVSRLIEAGVSATPALRLEKPRRSHPRFTTFPAESKGDVIRYFTLFHHTGSYELQLRAKQACAYQLDFSDPALALDAGGDPVDGVIEVGATKFYSLTLESGDLLAIGVGSKQFDPVTALYDPRGALLQKNDDGGRHLDSALSVLTKRNGRYFLQVSSVGNGGGGRFVVRPRVSAVPRLAIGQSARGRLGRRAEAYWAFSGKRTETVIISVSSRSCDVTAQLFGPDAVSVAQDDDGGFSTDSLMAVRLPAAGRYILKVASRNGAGDYRVRLIGERDA